eukprot:TRINITY_DN78722_c0_g1_i1.p1 TRINITY_DN78722_c0_g1~~TRINITY_DN78722_c0_g1_i1.p1  ORF type:complete len:483 (-),score=61.84 TRINITY_DN78722_c0_g1_i1:43-1491(-)
MDDPLLGDYEDVTFLDAAKLLLLPLYLPAALYLLSYGLGLIALPLYILRTLQMPYSYVGFYKIAQELAELASNNPSAWATQHWGWKGCLAAGALGFIASSLLLWLSTFFSDVRKNLDCFLVFLLGYFFQCGSMKFFNRGNGILTSELPVRMRGRHSNLLEGLRFLMTSVGPLLASTLTAGSQQPGQAVFFLMLVLGLLAFSLISLSFGRENKVKQQKKGDLSDAADGQGATDTGYWHFLKDMATLRDVVTVAGACIILVSLRGGYHMMIVIQGVHLNFGMKHIALVLAVCNGACIPFFWIGGVIIDSLGRKWSAIPACALFATSFFVLGRSEHLDDMCLSGAIFAVGETICGGIKQSLKADFTDRARRLRLQQTRIELLSRDGDAKVANAHKARFAAMVDNLLDLGGLIYPLCLTGISQHAGPSKACACWGAIGIIGVVVFVLIEGSFEKKHKRDTNMEICLKAFLCGIFVGSIMTTFNAWS